MIVARKCGARIARSVRRDRRSNVHAAAKKVEAIGLCSPGSVDSKTGTVLRTANLPCWRNFPLARRIEKHYHLPTRLINDANAAALAEARWGAGKGQASVFYVSLGTGIGTALILAGRIHEGRTGGAGEGGHVTINFRGPLCGCGKRGCVELYASGTAIAKRARSLLGSADGKRFAHAENGGWGRFRRHHGDCEQSRSGRRSPGKENHGRSGGDIWRFGSAE